LLLPPGLHWLRDSDTGSFVDWAIAVAFLAGWLLAIAHPAEHLL
jgi:hypothetical protein